MDQKYKIYVSDTPIYLINSSDEVAHLPSSESIETIQLTSPPDIITRLNSLHLPHNGGFAFYTDLATSEVLFEALLDHYDHEVASGGLVVNEDHRVLLIYRRGCWDLPKGKLDEGEGWPEAAKREVEEETGVRVNELRQLLVTTFYTFNRKGRPTLKETRWYLMTASQNNHLSPQTEEDIEEVRWVRQEDVVEYLKDSFPSLMDVIRQWYTLKE